MTLSRRFHQARYCLDELGARSRYEPTVDGLTRQLLSFARGQAGGNPTRLDICTAVSQFEKLLARLLDSGHELHITNEPGPITVKIDQSFVRTIVPGGGDEAIPRAVIAMARSLGMEVVAEGVESETQLRFLLSEGCHRVQGFFLGRPMPWQSLADIASRRRPPSRRSRSSRIP